MFTSIFSPPFSSEILYTTYCFLSRCMIQYIEKVGD
uniref:Uncharacterized protein n=1 Tax=Podoviridae sp. ct2nF21 TaxID=2826537 RepID=A0A8S5NFH0_9CAUD|nr:MAG TPA: hypothetical protein [Podoviridae sp. ct2nF21]